MKCRGCGCTNSDILIDDLGWMHYTCEYTRLRGLLEESNNLLELASDERDAALLLAEEAKASLERGRLELRVLKKMAATARMQEMEG
jgi:hypothetical protein